MAEASRLAEARELASIYRVLAGARVRADWQYRGPFVAFTVTQALVTVLDFLQIAVIFGQVRQLQGWSVAEVAFLYGTSSLAFHLSDVFVSQVERAPQRIKAGTFDSLLIRPLGPLLQLCADDFAFRRLGKLVQATAILGWALLALDVDWSPARTAVLMLMVVAGTVIFGAIWIIVASLSFWMIDGAELMNSFTYGSSYATQYPLSIMARWLRHLLTFVVPAAFVNYFPALYILDKPLPDGLPGAAPFLSPFVAAVLVVVARAAWSNAVRHYRSTGS